MFLTFLILILILIFVHTPLRIDYETFWINPQKKNRTDAQLEKLDYLYIHT